MLNNQIVKIAYMKKIIETIGDRIKRSRKALGLSQADVGAAAGISASAISQIESGDSKSLRIENIFPIAKLLKKDPEWLATGKGDEALKLDIYGAIVDLPDDNPQQTLDFIEFRWQKAEGLVASDRIAHYTDMIEKIKRDLDQRKKDGKG
jgi:transcriptional regulator with XRE-family HTH domain